MTRTCIVVSPYFPPSTLAGVHRARHLAKHLPAAGWTPVVVAVDEAFHEEQLDQGLAAMVPSSVAVMKVPALPARYCRPLGLGEISLRAWRPLRQAVMRLLTQRPVGAVLITGSPYYPMLMAAEIKQRFGVPVVLDFQDPWVSAWGATVPLWSKAGISHRLAVVLEPKAVRAGSFITSVSERQNDEMAARYPWLDRSRMAAIPIGGDPDDYFALRGERRDPQGNGTSDRYINFAYVGTIWPPVMNTVRALFGAIRIVRDRDPALYQQLRFNFFGTTAVAGDAARDLITPLAAELGVSDVVYEIPQRLPYLDALAIQANSSGILILGSDEPHYTASKIFGVLMSGRPYLSVFHKQSSSHEILSRAGGGIALSFGGTEELSALEQPIAQALARIAAAPDSFGTANPIAYAPFEATAIAQRYGAIFDSLRSATSSTV